MVLVVENSPANAGDIRDISKFDPWVGKSPWRRAWQPTPVFMPGESHGQRGLLGYGPQGRKESDVTEATDTFTFRPHNAEDEQTILQEFHLRAVLCRNS